MKYIYLTCLIALIFNATSQEFLNNHLGKYVGQLQLCYPDKTSDSVTFEISILPTQTPNRWKNTTTYFLPNGATQVKDYELIRDTLVQGNAHYILDEKDGILITETRIGNTFYSHYTVDGIYYSAQTTYETNYIDYELSCYQTTNKRESISEPDEENNKWKVESFNLLTVQKGRLFKKKS